MPYAELEVTVYAAGVPKSSPRYLPVFKPSTLPQMAAQRHGTSCDQLGYAVKLFCPGIHEMAWTLRAGIPGKQFRRTIAVHH